MNLFQNPLLLVTFFPLVGFLSNGLMGHRLPKCTVIEAEQALAKFRDERAGQGWIGFGQVRHHDDEARCEHLNAADLLVERGVSEAHVENLILPTKEGVARDLLAEIDEHKFQVVVMGKKSFHERKPFLMGSHASKVLHSAKTTILCLVDS